MSEEEAATLLHNLAVEWRNLPRNTDEKKGTTDISPETREFIQDQISWLAKFLNRKHGWSVAKVKRVIREMIEVTL